MMRSSKLIANPNIALAIFGLAAILLISIPAALFDDLNELNELQVPRLPKISLNFPLITGATPVNDSAPIFISIDYNTTLTYGELQFILANISEADAALAEINGTNHTMNSVDEQLYNYSYTPPIGNQSFRIHANDSLNNWNASQTYNFTVYRLAPKFLSITYSSNLTQGEIQTILTNISNVSTALIEIGGTNHTMELLASGLHKYYYVPAVGSHSFKIHANDTSDNWNTSPTHSFTVEQETPYQSVNSTVTDSTISSDSSIVNSVITNSTVTSSSIVGSTITNATVNSASITSDILVSGSFTYAGKTHTLANLPLSIIYNNQPYCGNSVCDSNEDCYSCSADCSTCDIDEVLDLSTADLPRLKYRYSALNNGEALTISPNKPKIALTKLEVNTSASSNAEIAVYKLESIDLPNQPSNIYQAFDINTTNISYVNNAKIYFSVNKTWITNQNATENTMLFQKYNGTWHNLTAQKLSSDNENSHFKSDTTSFSTFVISAQPVNNTPPPQFCGDNICNNNETYITCYQDCPPPVRTTCGNSRCELGENIYTCPQDCNVTIPTPQPTTLTQPKTTAQENKSQLEGYLVAKQGTCGDGTCNKTLNETYENCPQDCETILNFENIWALLLLAMLIGGGGFTAYDYTNNWHFAKALADELKVGKRKKIKIPQQATPKPKQTHSTKKTKATSINSYIDVCLKQNKNALEIRQALVFAGWPKDKVDQVMRNRGLL